MKDIDKYLENYVLDNDDYLYEAAAPADSDTKLSAASRKANGLELYRQLKGKKPHSDPGSKLQWAVDEPSDDDLATKIDKKTLDTNSRRLMQKLDSAEPFFIEGEAGWGKSSIVKSLAKKCGYTVITVYLDKAQKEDLEGIPVPVEGKTGAAQDLAIPKWAKVMEDNPDIDFLLFFDEMNQATPDVQNALMPIIEERTIAGREFNNFTVGCAGNMAFENSALYELSVPLRSRIKPVIKWESGTPEAWKKAMKFLHEKWDDKLDKGIINKFEDNSHLFMNPREVDAKIFQWMYLLKAGGPDNYDYMNADDYLWRLEGLAKDELTKSESNDLKKLADDMCDYMNSKQDPNDPDTRERGGRVDLSMIPKNVRIMIENGIKNGYVQDNADPKRPKYGISRQNIGLVVDDPDVNAEMLERFIAKLEAEGIKFKYEKDSEWKKAGYLDPGEGE